MRQALAIQSTAVSILEARAIVKPLPERCSSEHSDLLDCSDELITTHCPTMADLDLLQEQLLEEDDNFVQLNDTHDEPIPDIDDWDDPFQFGFGMDDA